MYLSHSWPARFKHFNGHQRAAVKRWWIYYWRRRQERETGFRAEPRPRHWVGPAERAKRAKKPSVNTCLVRHL